VQLFLKEKRIKMPPKINKNHESAMNNIWQRNLSSARDIRIELSTILGDSGETLKRILNQYASFNDTDSVGMFLSLLTCVGHFSGNSTVNITNHTSNLNLFLLLVGPSGK
jgi:hypothetical protein